MQELPTESSLEEGKQKGAASGHQAINNGESEKFRHEPVQTFVNRSKYSDSNIRRDILDNVKYEELTLTEHGMIEQNCLHENTIVETLLEWPLDNDVCAELQPQYNKAVDSSNITSVDTSSENIAKLYTWPSEDSPQNMYIPHAIKDKKSIAKESNCNNSVISQYYNFLQSNIDVFKNNITCDTCFELSDSDLKDVPRPQATNLHIRQNNHQKKELIGQGDSENVTKHTKSMKQLQTKVLPKERICPYKTLKSTGPSKQMLQKTDKPYTGEICEAVSLRDQQPNTAYFNNV